MLGLVSRAKGSACSWAHWLAEGICHSPAFCAVETLGSAVHSLSCSGLQWTHWLWMDEDGLIQSRGTEKVLPFLP